MTTFLLSQLIWVVNWNAGVLRDEEDLTQAMWEDRVAQSPSCPSQALHCNTHHCHPPMLRMELLLPLSAWGVFFLWRASHDPSETATSCIRLSFLKSKILVQLQNTLKAQHDFERLQRLHKSSHRASKCFPNCVGLPKASEGECNFGRLWNPGVTDSKDFLTFTKLPKTSEVVRYPKPSNVKCFTFLKFSEASCKFCLFAQTGCKKEDLMWLRAAL